MDLSKLSTEDLQAIQKGDLSSVSSDGLRAIAAQSKPKNKSYDVQADGSLLETGSPAAKEAMSPTAGMSGFGRFAAGYGKAGHDLVQGIGQAVGLSSRQDVADSRALDAPLMKTTGGKFGNLMGSILDTLPVAAIPGANTMGGAAAVSAGLGMLQPSTSTGETLKNAGVGAAAGPAGLLLGRGLGIGYNYAKSFLEPLLGGTKTIAARTAQAFAGNQDERNAAAQRLLFPDQTLPGVQPTSAELANNAGVSQLERTARLNAGGAQAFTARDQANRNAMVGALKGIAGTDADREAAVAAREAAASPLYKAAESVAVPGDNELAGLLGTPPLQAAMSRAQRLAATKRVPLEIPQPQTTVPKTVTQTSPLVSADGSPITSQSTMHVPGPMPDNPTYTGRALQYLNMGLKDEMEQAPQKGMGSHELQASKDLQNQFGQWIDKNHAPLSQADAAFAKLSGPINRMDIGRKITADTLPALSDFGNNTRINSNAFANDVMRKGDSIAAQVTGNPNSTLANTLAPHELNALNQIGQQLARKANAQEIGKAVGSNTAQNLVSQNAVRLFAGPMGLPSKWIEALAHSAIGQTAMRPQQWAAKVGEGQVMDHLTEAGLDPKKMLGLLTMKTNPVSRGIWERHGLLAPTTTQLVNAARQQPRLTYTPQQ